jgi:hypothetical protein
MSEENVDLIRALIEAANRLDVDAGAARLARDVVWEENAAFPGLKEVYRGKDEFRRWAEQLLEIFESPHQELVRITELNGNRVFTETVVTAHGTSSGVPVELRSGRCTGSRTARSRDVGSSGTGTKPSQPPDCRSRRCWRRAKGECHNSDPL